MAFGLSCGPCSSADPTADTVKVDPNMLSAEAVAEEEARRQAEEEEQEQLRIQADERQRELERRRQEVEMAAAAEESRRRAEEAARQRRIEEEELARKAQYEAEQLRLREEEAREAARKEQERQQQAAEAERLRQAAENEAARSKVDAWLKCNGFTAIDARKKSLMSGSKYPLHVAVSKKDADMVALLVRCKADVNAANSSGQTPAQLAQKSNKKGCQDQVLAALGVRPE